VTLRTLWSLRRWAYAAFLIYAVTGIPSRTGFRLRAPQCDMRLGWEQVSQSLTKMPHIILFGIFFLITAVQFDRVDRRMLGWSFAATLALGLIVELEETATRTGNCRMSDLFPDALGALIAGAMVVALAMIYRRIRSAVNP
jgi:hypothetical protein